MRATHQTLHHLPRPTRARPHRHKLVHLYTTRDAPPAEPSSPLSCARPTLHKSTTPVPQLLSEARPQFRTLLPRARPPCLKLNPAPRPLPRNRASTQDASPVLGPIQKPSRAGDGAASGMMEHFRTSDYCSSSRRSFLLRNHSPPPVAARVPAISPSVVGSGTAAMAARAISLPPVRFPSVASAE
jgi:hypothetical protein